MRENRTLASCIKLGLSVVVVGLVVAGGARPAVAQSSRVSLAADRLRSSDDYRVRMQAALTLGSVAEEDKESVVTPLCQALGDSNDLVRQAAAVALKKVRRPSAAGCLRSHAATERSAQVKLQLTRAMEAIDDGGSGGGASVASAVDVMNFTPRAIPNAKYYVAISSVQNNTNRSSSEIDRDILPAVRSKIESLGTHQIAPDKESPTAARAAMSKRKMKGYYLSCSVDPFDYSNRNLRVRVKCAVFDYPGKNLRGEVPAGLTQTGVSPGDHAAEDNLLQMAASRAVELFVQNFQ